MTTRNDTALSPSPGPAPKRRRPLRSVLGQGLSLGIALGAAGAALAALLWLPLSHRQDQEARPEQGEDVVRLAGPNLIAIKSGGPLGTKLVVATAQSESIVAPLLVVTGSVVARRLPVPVGTATLVRWDFSTPELANAYADWIKAGADVAFAKKQLATIQKLTKAQIDAQTDVVERLVKLVEAGTDPRKDLVAARAELTKMTLQGQKDEHEAETAVRNAERAQRLLERQLFQAGASPDLLEKSEPGTLLVVADVPEARVGLVRENMACTARFFAYPDDPVSGRVGSIAPVVSKERRTLRVFFEVTDSSGLFKAGMFAEVGVGTDRRYVLTVPADGVLHVGDDDYVLKADGGDNWRVTTVKVGETRDSRVEILTGLRAGDRVLGKGAILLKPLVVRSLQQDSDGPRAEGPRP
jgi:membrane fusion protein, heavy metal efflux system